MRKPSRFVAAFVLLFVSLQVNAFVLEDIEVEGLERVAAGKVFSVLPLRVNEEFNISRSKEIIQVLYSTGLFDDVALRRQGNKLVIDVVERPGIKGINIVGNETITNEQLLAGLSQANIAVGLVFDRLALERLRQELKEQYSAIGKYAARVNTNIDDLGDNQVDIEIDITEGKIAAIKKIRINGNSKISDKELLKQFQSGTVQWYAFWNSKDRYARSKLLADLDTMNNLYQDLGYLDFEVTATNVSLTPDKKDIFIDIEVREGGRYRVGDINISGKTTLDYKRIRQLISLKKGEIFSRNKAVRSSEAIKHLLRDNGYSFAEVNLLPQIHEDESIVDVAFIMDPKKETYVRRINIYGNEDTDDEVFRRELRQIEGAKFSSSKIEQSRRRLQRLPYVELTEISDRPVEGMDNQVDLDVKVTERFSGNFNIGAGYSNSSGATLSFSLNQENFFGTGNRINFTFRNNDSDTNYVIGFLDPYHTLSGISRAWNLSYRSIDYQQRDISNVLSSESDEIRVGLNYGIPVSENDLLGLGGQFEDVVINLSDSFNRDEDRDGIPNYRDNDIDGDGLANNHRSERGRKGDIDGDGILNEDDNDDNYDGINDGDINRQEVINCIRDNSGEFTNFRLNSSFNYDTRNRSTFTTDGSRIFASAEFYTPIGDSNYFKVDYSHRHYFPIDEEARFVFSAHGRVSFARAYNGSCIPFFDKYYVGGAKTLRGYLNNSLGPADSNDDSVGGNFRLVGNFDLYFPTDFLYDRERLRMGVFTDFGNVFATEDDFDVNELRGSYGLQVQWLTAIGGIVLNFSSPLNDQAGDKIESFQFELGTIF